MNKIKHTLLAFLFFYGISLANSAEMDPMPGLNKTEFRAAAFLPISPTFREIYGTAVLSLQFEQARGFRGNKNLEIWGNFEWIYGHGELGRSCGSSTIDMLNISLGLKVIGNVYHDRVYLYAGLGPNLGIIFIGNHHTCCVGCAYGTQHTHSCDVGFGGIAKSGGQFFFSRHFFLDLFADYLYLPIHFSNTGNLGGFKLGGGLSARY